MPHARKFRIGDEEIVVDVGVCRCESPDGPIGGGCRKCMGSITQERVFSIPEPVVADQPPPKKNNRAAIQDLVVKDIEERKRLGIERYGTPLQAHNGRDALVDAYQEALDLAIYLRQAIEERG